MSEGRWEYNPLLPFHNQLVKFDKFEMLCKIETLRRRERLQSDYHYEGSRVT